MSAATTLVSVTRFRLRSIRFVPFSIIHANRTKLGVLESVAVALVDHGLAYGRRQLRNDLPGQCQRKLHRVVIGR